MNRKILSAVAIAIAVACSANNANAQLLETISRVIPQRLTRPFQGSQPQQQQPTCSRPPTQPVYVQPVYTRPVYTQPVYQQPVYSQPVAVNPVVVAPTPAVPPAKVRAKQLGNAAKQQFRNRQYAQAKVSLDEIVKLVPNDASGWQFRGIVSFSMGDFESAAADVYDAMRLGNAWNRKSVDNLYGPNSTDYSVQLSKLAESVAQKPSMQGHFLLAYHHMVNEQFEDGKKELQNVLKLEPSEPLSKKLIVVLNQRLAKK